MARKQGEATSDKDLYSWSISKVLDNAVKVIRVDHGGKDSLENWCAVYIEAGFSPTMARRAAIVARKIEKSKIKGIRGRVSTYMGNVKSRIFGINIDDHANE